MLSKYLVINILFLCFIFYKVVYNFKYCSSEYGKSLGILNNQSTTSFRSPHYSNSSFDDLKQKVYDDCKSFSQRSRLLGPLQRNSSNGELYFPILDSSLQDMYLLLRYSPRKADEGGLHLQLATSYLLSKNLRRLSLQQQRRTTALVFLSERYEKDLYRQLEKWFKSIFATHTKATQIIRAKAGNQESWEHMMHYTKHNTNITSNTILFLLEDDYIYEAEMLLDTIEFFASHNPCFVHPTDYPDRYKMDINEDDGQITVVAGKTRLWRSITSTTVTYACRLRTFLAFEDIIMHPKNDWGASRDVRLRGGNAVFFGPIPSHGAHTETLLLPSEDQSSSNIHTAAYYKDWWQFARRALFEAQSEKTFPTQKMSEEDLLS